MIIQDNRVVINQGEFFCSCSPHTVSTVLGSCVAVCLFDSRRQIGGMNHFVIPQAPPHRADDGRYGNVGMRQLLDGMLAAGAHLPDLTAKLFGGAVPRWIDRGSRFAVGRSNVETARLYLHQMGIPVVAERVGGSGGIRVYFDTWDGAARVRLVRSTLGRRLRERVDQT